ncbi:conserved hypothetical protein [uncultured Desulfobacterium sp.]|uniref:Pyruvate formate-lyase activating enzyme n=1 Tax=uncultured Desulfobacterium sp. TaxID=201089 RepID=A0A445MVZ0_9BACT|nr:conserved hypothetical protein [uncultured Desulfobacterium sp.]
MSRFLLVDIGAGTMDVLYIDDESETHYKAVVKSPVIDIAQKAAAIEGNLIVTGCEMGGGPISNVLRQQAETHEVVMSASSAATIHHDLARVRSNGIRVVEDVDAEALVGDSNYNHLIIQDLQTERLKGIVEGFGVPFSFDVVGVCAQDHGVPGPGVSHLDFRHNIFKATLDKEPFAHALLFRGSDVPNYLSRLSSIAATAGGLPCKEIYVMDSGMAAIQGASMDNEARSRQNFLVLDVATSHTLGAAITGQEIAGFFEYHTRDITFGRLAGLLQELADGRINHKKLLEEGGHGAYIRRHFGFKAAEVIIVTGPRRALVQDLNLSVPMVLGAPFGDNMMTGTAGLLEAIRRRKG